MRHLLAAPAAVLRRILDADWKVHWGIPVVLLFGPMLLWFTSERAYYWLEAEDHIAETLTAVGYLLTSVLAGVVAVRLHRQGQRAHAVIFAVVAVAFFCAAGEEISWGQRILGFQGPQELVSNNQQGEANVHNLLGRYPLEGAYIVVGLIGAVLARTLVPRIPVLRDRPRLYSPPVRLAGWFMPVIVYYGWVDYIDPLVGAVLGSRWQWSQIDRLQETAELSLACGLALFLGSVWLLVRGDGDGEVDSVVGATAADDEAEVLAAR